ncbi:ATP/GTP-binding protein [Aspergillus ibericus CBS 121593]|uniref:NadR/Ttd14 AAA domain-containing protein n=1 Tax=Aspergillus ibericus CBS 121593 TaxID=1448316 RepID=A0A395GQT3_9EURO|nr:hypothetical protein BO80DRAFT_448483 [Aspergillus ibericus CBS 121593]RAK97308.1 hypothetical protein BO80DRAFT_448483 [Aspergillus ibericus CBS 121593]
MIQPRTIYIVGAHCTGKTTLTKALNPRYTDTIDEVVRHVMRTDGYNASHVRHPMAGLELQKRTLLAQFKAEGEMQDKPFLSDRSGIDPIVYAGFFLGRSAAEKLAGLKEWHVLRERMRKALVIVCEPANESWLSSDGVRMTCESIDEWRLLGQAFRAALQEHGIEFVAIPDDLENLDERVRFVERLLKSES